MEADRPQEDLDLPLLRIVAGYLVQQESPANAVLYLLSMAGVCRQWRAAAREAPTDIAFDATDNTMAPAGQWVLQKFRRQSCGTKRQVLESAASLFIGYTSLRLSGEAISDDMLQRVAAANGPQLLRVRLTSAQNVTDEGLWALLSACPRLQELQLEDVGPGVRGGFLPAALHACRQLQALHVAGAPGISWATLQWWPVGPAGSPGGVSSSGARAAAGQGASGSGQAAAEGGAGAGVVPAGSVTVEGTPAAASAAAELVAADEDVVAGGLAGPGEDAVTAAGSLSASNDGGSLSSDEADLQPAAPGGKLRGGSSRRLTREHHSGSATAGVRGDASTSGRGADGAGHGFAPLPHAWNGERPRTPLMQMQRLHIRAVNVGTLQPLLVRMPCLTDLEVDGPARNIQLAAISCPALRRVSYLVSSRVELENALWSFTGLTNLRALELVVKNMVLSTDHMKVLGMLPVNELRIDSHAFKQQPSLSRPQFSHVDNEGVKGLVDAICTRLRVAASAAAAAAAAAASAQANGTGMGQALPAPAQYEPAPLRLSLCGATSLSHEAVSALLRLPILTELDIGGCCKITAMDKMRLVAKVKAGRELLEGGNKAYSALQRALRFPGLLF